MTGTRFAGAGVLVTGAASGIGRRVGERFAAEGARVVCLDRAAPTTTDHLAGWVAADVSDETSVAAAFEKAVDTVGRLSVVVHCAGIHHLAPLTSTSVDDWQRVNDVNALGSFLVTRAAGAHMVAGGSGGRVITIASMAAKQGGANESAYAASKAAVVALSRVAALEWGPHGITVNAVCPGYVPTEMGADSRTDEDIRHWSSLSPLGRLGTPDDVAGVVLFLASEEGGYLTGQAVNVTGGMAMH